MYGTMLYGFLDKNGFIDKNKKFTDDENKIIYDYLDKINGKVVHFNIQPFYTRIVAWRGLYFYFTDEFMKKMDKHNEREKNPYKFFDTLSEFFIETREKMGFDYVDTIRYLENQKIVRTLSQSFTGIRITNNEIIAHNAIRFVKKLSKEFPDDILFIDYDRDSLYCPILVKNEKAKPYLERVKSSLGKDENIIGKITSWIFKLIFNPIEMPKSRKQFYEALLEKEDYEWIPIEYFERPYNPEALIGMTAQPYHFSESPKELVKELDKEEKETIKTVPLYDDVDYFPYEIIEKYGK